jgi:hypothetical protein
MPVYEIDLYELHKQTYRVEAASPALALQKIEEMDCKPVPDSLVYLRTIPEGSLESLDEAFPGLIDELEELGIDHYEETSIYDMRQVD